MASTKNNKTVERKAYTLEEFSAVFGRSRFWGYKQVKKGRVRPITGFGAMLIPVSEVERILEGKGAA